MINKLTFKIRTVNERRHTGEDDRNILRCSRLMDVFFSEACGSTLLSIA